MQLPAGRAGFRALAALAAVAHMLVQCRANSLRQAGRVARGDAEAALAAEMNESHSEARLVGLEDSLRATFTSLPKDAQGRLGHAGVRYVLHRLFVQRHGWYIKGLEPGSDEPRAGALDEEEWVPSFLQQRLESRLAGRGASLRDLAVLAAAVEDLVRKEAVGRLRAVYEMHALPTEARLDRDQFEQVITTFYVTFLREGEFSADSPGEAERLKLTFAQGYAGWAEAAEWLKGTVAAAVGPEDTGYDYEAVERIALDIGERYYQFNDMECQSLKVEMHGIESKKAGRVRLPEFYKKALYSHWQFDEKLEYLRTLGAADETEPANPLVILPNYLTARTNCLEATGLYALCCRSECEDLMGRLEIEVAAPEAAPDRLAELVAAMPSDTVQAPRVLPPGLLRRLSEVAAAHGGKVPLHGRLFAQWMHHAFPRECPYPHESGTTSPQTPDDWMRVTGQATHDLNQDQLKREVEADTCAWVPGEGPTPACGQAEDLPWSSQEELLAGGIAAGAPPGADARLAAVASVSLLVILAIGHAWKAKDRPRGILDEEPLSAAAAARVGACRLVQRERLPIAACALLLGGYAADVLDGTLVLFGATAGLLRIAASRGAERLQRANKVPKSCE